MLAISGWVMAVTGFSLTLIVLRERAARVQAVERACHELRGPLTAARLGLAVGLRAGRLGRERLRAVDLELGRAALALDDLGGVSVTRAPTFSERIEVRELLADSVEAWRAAASTVGVDVGFSWQGAPAEVLGERFRIAQATGNLIANAIEHGGEAVQVLGRPDDDRVRIEVLDNGPGLPAPLAHLTRRRRGRGRTGRGHGLAIATAIVEAHGGRIWSAPSRRGARVLIDLPRAVPQGEVGSSGA